jgi:enterochelin esterase-like enzyme
LKKILLLALLTGSAHAAARLTATELIELSKTHPGQLTQAIQDTFAEKDLKAGTAWAGNGPDFFFAIESGQQPKLEIDDAAGPPMNRIASTALWYASAHIEPVASLHSFQYIVGGSSFGGSLDLPVFGPDSYPKKGVPQGTLSPKQTFVSKIYDGMSSDYWVYVPAQYDPNVPAALMVFQDGGANIGRTGSNPVLTTVDNLIAQKKIPVMILVLINPGTISEKPSTPTYEAVKKYSDKWHRPMSDSMRSVLYDSVSGRYDRFLRDEILADIGTRFNIRKDAYSRGIAGGSSGGICAFNAAWQMPDQFSRVLSHYGSFVGIQWEEGKESAEGGQDYPDKVLRGPKRNIRVWLQDGNHDMEDLINERRYGSWPFANLRMANALKSAGYDFHFAFGQGTHNPAQGAAELPTELTWLWRDYDSSKTEEIYEMEPVEKAKPEFRVTVLNRDTR